MGNKVEPRRKWIESHVQFTLEEDGSILDRKAIDDELAAVLGFMNEDESLDFVAIHYDELDEIEDDDKSKEEK